jgi:hypothetical protein
MRDLTRMATKPGTGAFSFPPAPRLLYTIIPSNLSTEQEGRLREAFAA